MSRSYRNPRVSSRTRSFNAWRRSRPKPRLSICDGQSGKGAKRHRTRTIWSLPLNTVSLGLYPFNQGKPTVINCNCAVEVGEENQLRLGLHVRKNGRPHCDGIEDRTLKVGTCRRQEIGRREKKNIEGSGEPARGSRGLTCGSIMAPEWVMLAAPKDFPVLVIFSPGFCDGSSATISTARPGLDFAVDCSSRSVR